MTFEIQILDWIQDVFRCPFLDTVMPLITALANGGVFWIALALVLTINKKTRPLGIAVILSMVLEAVCCNLILKPLVARTRPFEINRTVELLIAKPLDYSFPSGHTGCSFAVASALFFGRSPDCIFQIIAVCPLSHGCSGGSADWAGQRMGSSKNVKVCKNIEI